MPASPPTELHLGRQQMFFLVAQSAFRAGLTPQLEQVLAAVQAKLELPAEEAEKIAYKAREAIAGKEARRFSKSRIMNEALHLALASGDLDQKDMQILLAVGKIFGMPEAKVRAVVRSRIAGDSEMMLSMTDASMLDIAAEARRVHEAAEAARKATLGQEPVHAGLSDPSIDIDPPAPPVAPRRPPDEDEVTALMAEVSEPPPAPEPEPEPEVEVEEEEAAGEAPPPATPAPPSFSLPKFDLTPKVKAGLAAGLALVLLGSYGAWNLYAARVAQQQTELLEKMIRDASKEILDHCKRALDLAKEGKVAGGEAELEQAAAALERREGEIEAEARRQGKLPPENLLAFPAAEIPAFRSLVAQAELEQDTARFQPLDVRIPQVEKIVAHLDEAVTALRKLKSLDTRADAEFKNVAKMHTQWSDALKALVLRRKNERGF